MDIYSGFTTEDPVYEVGDIDDALAIIKVRGFMFCCIKGETSQRFKQLHQGSF